MAVNLKYFYPVIEWNEKIEKEVLAEVEKEFENLDLNYYASIPGKNIFEKWEMIIKEIFPPVCFIDLDDLGGLMDAIVHGQCDQSILKDAPDRYELYEADVWMSACLAVSYINSRKTAHKVNYINCATGGSILGVFPETGMNSSIKFCQGFKGLYKKGSDPDKLSQFNTGIYTTIDKKESIKAYPRWIEDLKNPDNPKDSETKDVTRWGWWRQNEREREIFSSCYRDNKISEEKVSQEVREYMSKKVLYPTCPHICNLTDEEYEESQLNVAEEKSHKKNRYKSADLLINSKLINAGIVRRCIFYIVSNVAISHRYAVTKEDDASMMIHDAIQFQGKAWQIFWVEIHKALAEKNGRVVNDSFDYNTKPEIIRGTDSDKDISDILPALQEHWKKAFESLPKNKEENKEESHWEGTIPEQEELWKRSRMSFEELQEIPGWQYMVFDTWVTRMGLYEIVKINNRLSLLTKMLIFLYEKSEHKDEDFFIMERIAIDEVYNLDRLGPLFAMKEQMDAIDAEGDKKKKIRPYDDLNLDIVSDTLFNDLYHRKEYFEFDKSKIELRKDDIDSITVKYCYLQACAISFIQEKFKSLP